MKILKLAVFAIGLLAAAFHALLAAQESLPSAGSQPEPPGAVAIGDRGVKNLASLARAIGLVRFFHASDEAAAADWSKLAIAGVEITGRAEDAGELVRGLEYLFASIAPTVQFWSGGPDAAPPEVGELPNAIRFRWWEHKGVQLGSMPNVYRSARQTCDLDEACADSPRQGESVESEIGGGVWIRVPIRVYADQTGTLPKATQREVAPRAGVIRDGNDRATRLADVMIAWSLFEHFYPYPDVVEGNWDDALRVSLRDASRPMNEADFLGTLRRMVAKLNDGHGGVYHPRLFPAAYLPLSVAWVDLPAGPELVITESFPAKVVGDAQLVRAGDIVQTIGGVAVADRYRDESATISAATEQWRREVARQRMLECNAAGPVELRIRGADGIDRMELIEAVSAAKYRPSRELRPVTGSEIDPGIVYFDLNNATKSLLEGHLRTLQRAKAVIFDLRGYPDAAGYELFQYISAKPVRSAWWCVPVRIRPDREPDRWEESRWDISPSRTQITGKLVFITDGSAISYAESCMAIVEHYKLGEIVGSATAGTNGNVNPFELTGGYRVVWTGMKVEKHDRTPHHGIGVLPTVPVERTYVGIAEGRDELLERAIEVAKEP